MIVMYIFTLCKIFNCKVPWDDCDSIDMTVVYINRPNIIKTMCICQCADSQSQTAVFLPEFTLSPRGSFMEGTTEDQFLTYRYDDQVGQHTLFFLDQ